MYHDIIISDIEVGGGGQSNEVYHELGKGRIFPVLQLSTTP
jgi:hypothetical protein